MKDIITLAVESSCDETSVAVLKNGREVLSNIINTQVDLHKKFGGVVPEVASRNHIENIVVVLQEALDKAKSKKGPVLLHVITKKGKGYRYAEEQPDKYHGVSKFDIKSGIKGSNAVSISNQVGQKLSEMANKNENIVAITAAMPSGTGLNIFEKNHPNRYYDVGIAEQHATTFAAGLAKNGMKPYFAVYSSFLQRAYDQIIHDVCITSKPVTFLIDRAGIVGNDGETHHGMFDLSYLNNVPNITVMAPKDSKELDLMLELSLKIDSPVAIRYPRGNSYYLEKGSYEPINLGSYEILSQGKDIVVLLMHDTYGKEETAKALPTIIKYFKDNGYEFKTLS